MRGNWSKLGPFTVGQGKSRLNFRHLLLSLSRDQDDLALTAWRPPKFMLEQKWSDNMYV